MPSLEQVRDFVRLADEIKAIVHVSGVSWETKYDLIFSRHFNERWAATEMKVEWSDPDTSCEEDVRAFVDAMSEKADELRLLLPSLPTRSFRDLQQDEHVTVQELKEVLEEYATTGSSIASPVVIDLINRTDPSTADCEQMIMTAAVGRSRQLKGNHIETASAYLEVIDHLALKL